MLPTRCSTLLGHNKLWFLTLAVLVVLAQTSPEGWFRTCHYGMGKCRRICRANEKKKERCGENTFCCLGETKSKLSHIPTTKERKRDDLVRMAININSHTSPDYFSWAAILSPMAKAYKLNSKPQSSRM
ncbi:beta-defensin 115 [Apodemus sylvaticus]|uniref:beta-defensin 115 n=1 Tax=Apodemus sylvaticus TaxID=10129 RepID=UPI0022441974|nr:beta-defensin 115 [Apodemus sylvaticus]